MKIVKKILKFIRKLFGSKSFIGSIVFALSLWGYVALNKEDYLTSIKVPLVVELPPNRAIETLLPPTVTIEVRGSGWRLFNLIFVNNTGRCFIDFSSEHTLDSTYEISKTDILKGVQFLTNIQAVNVLSEKLSLKIGNIGEYAVRVNPLIKVIPRQGFMLVGNIKIEPDMIKIWGNNKIVGGITSWDSRLIKVEDVFKSFEI